MNLNVWIQLIFLCVVNIVFTCCGIILNTLVADNFLKSSRHRKKLCHFMIIVLPCFDFLALITTHPAFLLYLVSWWTGDYTDLLNKMGIYTHCTFIAVGFSFYSLLVMNTERYLVVYYPMFHWNSVTRRNLLTLLAILFLLHTTVVVITANDMIISQTVDFIVFMAIAFPPFMFVNYILSKNSRKLRWNNRISPEEKSKNNWKNISTCLLVVACLVTLSIPCTLFLAFNFVRK